MNKEQKEIYRAADDIFWNDWDPIGVNDIAPRDEYQSYVPEIFSMLIHNKTENEIADRLYKIETETMGEIGSKDHCLEITKKLITEKNAPQHWLESSGRMC